MVRLHLLVTIIANIKKLAVLNLSGNRLDDQGAKYLAEALRSNQVANSGTALPSSSFSMVSLRVWLCCILLEIILEIQEYMISVKH